MKKFFGTLVVGLFFVVGTGYGAALPTEVGGFKSTTEVIKELKKLPNPGENPEQKTTRLNTLDKNGRQFLTTATENSFTTKNDPASKIQRFNSNLAATRKDDLLETPGTFFSGPSTDEAAQMAINAFLNLELCPKLKVLAEKELWDKIPVLKQTKSTRPSKPMLEYKNVDFLKWVQALDKARRKLTGPYSWDDVWNNAIHLLATKPATPLEQLATSLTALKAKLAALATALNGLGH